jgi:hypothetical protein
MARLVPLFSDEVATQAAFSVFGRIDDKTQILFEDNWL